MKAYTFYICFQWCPLSCPCLYCYCVLPLIYMNQYNWFYIITNFIISGQLDCIMFGWCYTIVFKHLHLHYFWHLIHDLQEYHLTGRLSLLSNNWKINIINYHPWHRYTDIFLPTTLKQNTKYKWIVISKKGHGWKWTWETIQLYTKQSKGTVLLLLFFISQSH